MKIKTYLLLLFFATIIQAQDVIYYDKDWQTTTKENHVYYRKMPLKKVGELLYLVDYYKNGTMQFQGYIYPNDEHNYVGDAYWYDENGLDDGIKQSINKSSEKELMYFNQDGSIWQKINYDEDGEKSKITVYHKGKELFWGSVAGYNQYKGTFSPKIPDDYYETSEMEEKRPTYTEVAPMIGMETTEPKKPEKSKEFYFEVIYWENGKKAKESKFELTEYGNSKLVEETYWDEAGKLISEINLENFSKEKKYLEVGYYTRNNFAFKVKEKFEMVDKEKNGITTYYNSKGEIKSTEKYIKGEKTEETTYENGKPTVAYYKNFEPFEGNFTKEFGNKSQTYTLKNGKIEGEVVVTDKETNKVVAKGIYKNDLPVDGSFYVDNSSLKLYQYKNGKQEGIQKFFDNYWDEELSEEFEMKAGKREGFRKIYEDGSVKYESIYKNDTIVSGKIREGDEELIYDDGNLTERLFLKEYDEGFERIEKYENNELSAIEYFNFTIDENPQESYQGKYKNGKPFQGYFQNQVVVDDIHLVDYYENGQIKYQYSFNFLEQMDNYRHYVYTEKAEFENGKVINGAEFLPPTRNSFLKLNYKNKKVNGLEINLFGMHYFNRINFIREENEIRVTEFESPYTVKIFPKDNFITTSLYENDKLIKEQKPISEVKEGSPNSSTFYFVRDNQIKTYSVQKDNYNEYDGIDTHQFAVKILSVFPLSGKMNLDDVMNHFSKAFQSEDFDHIFDVDDYSLVPISSEEYLSFLEYDENGKPGFGIRIKQEKNGEILAEGIEDDKVKKSVKVKSISELKANDHKILQDLMHKLLNE